MIMEESLLSDKESHSHAGRLVAVLCRGLAAAIVLCVFATNVYRAATQSITHDEAVTYNSFLAEKLYRLFTRYDANHHFLNTYLCLLTTWLFGVSEFSMRLPSLCGGALYLGMAYRLCRTVYGNGIWFLLAVATLCLNPFLLDFLSLARGYGLALGFSLWAVFEMVRNLDQELPGSPGVVSPARLRKVSILMAFAVLSNLTFLPVMAALAAVFAALRLTQGRLEQEPLPFTAAAGPLIRGLVQPGLIVFVLFGVALLRAGPADFYVGEESAAKSLQGIVQASLAHHHTTWLLDTEGVAFRRFVSALCGVGTISLLAAMIACCGSISARWWRQRVPLAQLESHDRFLLFTGISFLLTIGVVFVLHALLHVKYPFERTGLYLAPLFSLCVVSTIRTLWSVPGLPRAAGCLGSAVQVIVVAQFVAQWHTGYYRTWQYDAGTRRIFDTICARHDASGGTIRVTASPILEPSLNFYRRSRHAFWLEEIRNTDAAAEVTTPCDYYAIVPQAPPAWGPFTPLVTDPESGTILAIPQKDAQRIAPVGN